MLRIVYIIPFIPLLFGCRQSGTPGTLFEAIPANQSGIFFSNQLTESAAQSIATHGYFYNVRMIAADDLDGHGLPGLFNLLSKFIFLLKC